MLATNSRYSTQSFNPFFGVRHTAIPSSLSLAYNVDTSGRSSWSLNLVVYGTETSLKRNYVGGSEVSRVGKAKMHWCANDGSGVGLKRGHGSKGEKYLSSFHRTTR